MKVIYYNHIYSDAFHFNVEDNSYNYSVIYYKDNSIYIGSITNMISIGIGFEDFKNDFIFYSRYGKHLDDNFTPFREKIIFEVDRFNKLKIFK